MPRMLAGTRKGQRRKTARRAYMPAKRRTTRRRRKGMLSELFSSATSQASAKQVFSGAGGGAGAMFLEKALSNNLSQTQKGAYQVVAGFLTASLFKKGYVGAGMSAIGIANIIQDNDLLGEGHTYSDVDMTQPMFLDEDLMLADNMMLANNHYLAEEMNPMNYNVGYFPEGFGGLSGHGGMMSGMHM